MDIGLIFKTIDIDLHGCTADHYVHAVKSNHYSVFILKHNRTVISAEY